MDGPVRRPITPVRSTDGPVRAPITPVHAPTTLVRPSIAPQPLQHQAWLPLYCVEMQLHPGSGGVGPLGLQVPASADPPPPAGGGSVPTVLPAQHP